MTEQCQECENYKKALMLIKKYYRDNPLLNVIIKKALKKEEISDEEIIKEKWE